MPLQQLVLHPMVKLRHWEVKRIQKVEKNGRLKKKKRARKMILWTVLSISNG